MVKENFCFYTTIAWDNLRAILLLIRLKFVNSFVSIFPISFFQSFTDRVKVSTEKRSHFITFLFRKIHDSFLRCKPFFADVILLRNHLKHFARINHITNVHTFIHFEYIFIKLITKCRLLTICFFRILG